MQAQAQAALQDFFSGAPGEKLKTAATAQLLLSLLLTFWAGNLSGALALLGLLAVVLSNSEFLRLYFYLCPVDIVVSVFKLALSERPAGYSLLLLLQLLAFVAEGAGIYFAYDLYNLSAGLDVSTGDYQSFNDAPATRNDPFYEPATANADHFQPPPPPV